MMIVPPVVLNEMPAPAESTQLPLAASPSVSPATDQVTLLPADRTKFVPLHVDAPAVLPTNVSDWLWTLAANG